MINKEEFENELLKLVKEKYNQAEEAYCYVSTICYHYDENKPGIYYSIVYGKKSNIARYTVYLKTDMSKDDNMQFLLGMFYEAMEYDDDDDDEEE